MDSENKEVVNGIIGRINKLEDNISKLSKMDKGKNLNLYGYDVLTGNRDYVSVENEMKNEFIANLKQSHMKIIDKLYKEIEDLNNEESNNEYF